MKTSFEEDQEAETLLNGSLNGDSLPFAFSQRAKNARNLHWKSLAFALFVGLSIGVFMVVATGGLPRSWEPRQGSAALQPRFPIVPVTFNRDSLWERPLGDPEGDLAWGSLIPEGDGYVEIDNPGKYNLNVLDGKEEVGAFGMSMYHQLHCLHLIRDSYYRLLDGRQPKRTEGHHKHCFNFVRQGLMCAGDTTLEAFQDIEPGIKAQVSYNTIHQCRDWDAIYKFATEFYVPPNDTRSGLSSR